MRKKLVNEKRTELKHLPRRELVDRILDYHNQDLLNVDENGVRRDYPIGKMAEGIRDRGYQMSENQYRTLVHHFAGLTVQDMKVVGITFRPNNAAEFERTLVSREKRMSIYETDYTLIPEPDNPHDPNAVKVMAHKLDGSLHHLGYIARDFVAAHPITETMDVHGRFIDYSGGKFKMVSYQLALDTEKLDNLQAAKLAFTDADLMGIGDLGLDLTGRMNELSNCMYERPFRLNGVVWDTDAAADYVNGLGFKDDLHAEFEAYGQEDPVSALTWVFDGPSSGRVWIESERPLNEEQKLVADAFIHHLHTDGYLGVHLKEQPFQTTKFPDDSFADDRKGFSLAVHPILTDADLEFAKGFVRGRGSDKGESFQMFADADLEFAKGFVRGRGSDKGESFQM